jgi:two-component system nitrogen regulation sensor histidine kinase NtrY
MIVAVPMVRAPGEIHREVQRVAEIILVATVLLGALLFVAATYLARTVARPLRALAAATAQIAAGDYATRLQAETRDEVADLVRGFNAMAQSLKQQRAALEQRREYIETLLQHATTGVLSIDDSGAIVTLNPTATDLLSAAGADVGIGTDLTLAVESAGALTGLRAALRGGAAAAGEPVEFDLENKGQPRRLRMVRVPLPGSAGRSVGTLILLDDVTELTRSNQLAAWAEMARSIAHEIKNPLTPIQLSAEHLLKLLDDRGVLPDDKIEACVETVIKQVRTLYEIAGEFSTYAKLPVLKPEPHDPAEFMRETMSPYRSSTLAGIELLETYEDVPKVAIDYRVLSRAVINLIENAIQAMPNGGRLDVSVTAAEDEFIEIGVDDNGTGLDPEVKRRLFEPYFSTKSSGTGLGLAIARQAIEAHQGTIDVDSTPGEGTRFRIRLPVIGTG